MGDYNGAGDLVIGSVDTSYAFYSDVAMMIFIGFGFLMTFLAKYAHSSLGYTFMMTAVTIQYSLLAQGFFHHLHAGDLFDGDVAKCVETAAASVQTDFDACAAVTALDDSAACAAVMGSVDDSVAVCTYHPKVGVEESCVATAQDECILDPGNDCSVAQPHCTYTAPDLANNIDEACAATEQDECVLTPGEDCSVDQPHCTYTAPVDSPAPVIIDVTNLIHALFASGAVMISFGAVLGRTSPSQLMVMTFFGVTCFHFNEWIGAGELKAIDMGGSMFVHMFGSYFGLACSFMLHRGTDTDEAKKDNTSRYDSNVTAMLDTVVLWILWPSFNGALAPTPDSQMRVVINTVLALTSSTTFAFMMSHMVGRGRFNMTHIQNARLLGVWRSARPRTWSSALAVRSSSARSQECFLYMVSTTFPRCCTRSLACMIPAGSTICTVSQVCLARYAAPSHVRWPRQLSMGPNSPIFSAKAAPPTHSGRIRSGHY